MPRSISQIRSAFPVPPLDLAEEEPQDMLPITEKRRILIEQPAST